MFAGPNGSGKSTTFNIIQSKFNLGYYLNADEIEKELKHKGFINLKEFGLLYPDEVCFRNFISGHSFFKKAQKDGFAIDLKWENNLIKNTDQKTHSYEASILSDFLRTELIEKGQRLTFETVMSHPSKIETLRVAKEKGFKNYLYFICTEDPEINKSRVAERVVNKGHPVPEDKIINRYYRSLNLLLEAVSYTYRTYIFDNSGSKSKLILDIFEGKTMTYHTSLIPLWVDKYLLQKLGV